MAASLGGLLLIGVTVAGCSDDPLPISPEQATQTAQRNTRATFEGASRSLAVIQESEVIDSLDELFASNDCSSGAEDPIGPLATGEQEVRAALDELVDWLEEHVFRDDLVESEDGTHVVYRLQPETICEAQDEGCQSFLTDHPIRLDTSSPAEGDLDVALLVGEQRRPVASMRLYRDRVSVRVALAQLKQVVEEVTADDADAPELPAVLDGIVELTLLTHGDGDVELQGAILEAVRLEADLDKAQPLKLRIAPSDALASLRLRGGDKRISMRAGVNETDLSLPSELLCNQQGAVDSTSPPARPGAPLPDENPNPDNADDDSACGDKERDGVLALHLAGARGSLELDGASERVELRDITLGKGSSTVKLSGETLARLDLNPDHGRKFDAKVQQVEGGVEVTIEPAIDLKLALALTHLSESMRLDMPDWLMDELFEVMIGGPPRARLLIPGGDPCGTSAGQEQQLQVLEGAIELAASSLDQSRRIEAGQCVVGTDAEDTHLFELFDGGVCQ